MENKWWDANELFIEEQMTGFLCATPYHLLVCLGMAINDYNNDEKTLIIMNRFSDAKRLADQIKQLNIFKHVIFLETHDFDWLRNWNRRFRMFIFYPEIIKLFQVETFDNFIFFPPNLLEVSFLVKYAYKGNKNCKFYYAEDGIGSYINQDIYKPHGRGKKWLKLLGRLNYLKLIDSIYLYHPELCVAGFKYNKLKIDGARTISTSYLGIVNSLWKFNDNRMCDALLIDQPFESSGEKNVQLIQDRSFVQIAKYFKNCFIKYHPRDQKCTMIPGCQVLSKNSMFEVMILNGFMPKYLFSVHSTALVTPFILWNMKPTIIFLYKLCNIDSRSLGLDKFLERFRTVYEHEGGEVYLPETFDELNSLVKNFTK
jgi:hypothetical protein